MPEIKKEFKCRIEEMPTLSKFIYDALVRDLADFSAEFPDFNAGYITNFTDRIKDVNDLINPIHFTNSLKIITARQVKNMKAMRPFLDKLEGYVKLAAKPGGAVLTVTLNDFGFKKLREAITDDDVEGLDLAFRTMKKNITDNYAALVAKGYGDAKRDALYALADAVNDDNALQNLEVDKRDKKVEDNLTPLNTLWKIMTEVCDFGKRVYKSTHQSKLDDYTMESLLNRVRNEDARARFRSVTIEANKTNVLSNVIDNTKATNMGETNLEWSPGSVLNNPQLWATHTQVTVTTMNGKITIRNISTDEDGRCRVKALGSTRR